MPQCHDVGRERRRTEERQQIAAADGTEWTF